MAEGDESLADESGGMAPDEEGTTDEPLEEPGDEVATDQAPEESGPQEQPGEEIDESDDPAEAACAGYGQRCGGFDLVLQRHGLRVRRIHPLLSPLARARDALPCADWHAEESSAHQQAGDGVHRREARQAGHLPALSARLPLRLCDRAGGVTCERRELGKVRGEGRDEDERVDEGRRAARRRGWPRSSANAATLRVSVGMCTTRHERPVSMAWAPWNIASEPGGAAVHSGTITTCS